MAFSIGGVSEVNPPRGVSCVCSRKSSCVYKACMWVCGGGGGGEGRTPCVCTVLG